jgi:hypothetical protein
VTTKVATAIGTTSATLNGSANPNGATTTGWFRYHTSNPGSCNDNFGTRAPLSGSTNLGSGTTAVNYSRALTGLTVGQGYYFCAIANNTPGTRFGAIRFFVPVRFPVGMFKEQVSDMGIAWTPDGKHLRVAGDIPALLASAKAAGARIVIHVTRDNTTFLRNPNGTFNIAKWKAEFDSVAAYGNALRQYVKDGTLIGHYALDEPFFDFTNFQAADLEEICRYQKLSWPFVACLVRVANEVLARDTIKPAGGYRYVDAGWAQLVDFAFENPPYNGDVQAYYQDNLDKGRQVGLGLMYGFSLLTGGHEDPPGAPEGCESTPPTNRENCAMTATEIRTMADKISNLGHDQGCGIIGWQLAKDPPPALERQYFLGTGEYSTTGVQSALQYLWTKTAGANPALRPGTCNIRGDLPPP